MAIDRWPLTEGLGSSGFGWSNGGEGVVPAKGWPKEVLDRPTLRMSDIASTKDTSRATAFQRWSALYMTTMAKEQSINGQHVPLTPPHPNSRVYSNRETPHQWVDWSGFAAWSDVGSLGHALSVCVHEVRSRFFVCFLRVSLTESHSK